MLISSIVLYGIGLYLQGCFLFEDENKLPQITITSPSQGQEVIIGETVLVTATATDEDGNITEVTFSIDGVQKEVVNTPPYQYSWSTTSLNAGPYTIQAECVDDEGEGAASEVTVSLISDEEPPVAAFSANPVSGTSPLLVMFTDESTNNPTAWEWDFGDGNSSVEQNPTHTYTDAGDYTVTLEAFNSTGSDIIIKQEYISVSASSGNGEPCPGVPSVTYEGEVYPTVQIGTQCWMQKNLNVGTRINSNQGGFLQTDNGIIEKYCIQNEETNCDIYGGLYEWHEAMQYVTDSSAQGICPDGWHIPTDYEWEVMEGTVDSLYGIGDIEWDATGWRGSNAGTRLKQEGHSLWEPASVPGFTGNNQSGFTALPGGYRREDGGHFFMVGYYAYFWTSTQLNIYGSYSRGLTYDYNTVYRKDNSLKHGFSVRCLKD